MKQFSIILTGLFMLASCGNAQAMQDFFGLQTKETALLDAVKKLTPEERAALEKVIELTRQEAKHEAKESVLSKLGSLARTVLESQSGSQPEEQPASQTTLKTIKDLWGTLMGPTEAPRA